MSEALLVLTPKAKANTRRSYLSEPGELCHNVAICLEIIHKLGNKKGRKGGMILKIDMEKAYDQIEWEFVANTLREAGIPSTLSSIMMECVTNSQFRLLCNGETTEIISPSRGMRQGDPVSPYLCVLRMDRLSHIICKEVDGGRWKPLQASSRWPKISYLFFADDLLLFAEASDD